MRDSVLNAKGLSRLSGGSALDFGPFSGLASQVVLEELPGTNQTWPQTFTPTLAAGSNGVLITLGMNSTQFPTVTVNGAAAELVASTGNQYNNGLLVMCAYYAQTTDTTPDITIDWTGDRTRGAAIVVTSVQGGPVASWRVFGDADPQAADVQRTFTISGVEWGEGDAVFGLLLGERNPLANDFGGFTGCRSQSGTIHIAVGHEVKGSAASAQSINWGMRNTHRGDSGLVLVASKAEADAVRLVPAPFQTVYQISGANASVPVVGTYTGTAPSSVEARVVRWSDPTTEVLTWTTLDASPSGGAFSGTLTVPRQPYGMRVEVRPSGGSGITDAMRIGTGLYIAAYGQSNTGGQTGIDLGFTVTSILDGSAYHDRLEESSVHAGTEIISIGNFAGLRGLISEIESLMGCGVIYTNSAKAGAALAVLSTDPERQLLLDDISRVGLTPQAFYWWQGEAEGASGLFAGYAADFDTFHGALATSLGVSKSDIPFVICTLGPTTDGDVTDANWAGINGELIDAADTYADVHLFSDNADGVLSAGDPFHFDGATQELVSKRGARGIAVALGEATPSAIFRIGSITKVSTTVIDVNLTHGIGTDYTPTTGITGFTVSANSDMSSPATLSSVVRQDASTIRITLSAAIAGTVHLTYQTTKGPYTPVVDNGTYSMPLLRQIDALSAS